MSWGLVPRRLHEGTGMSTTAASHTGLGLFLIPPTSSDPAGTYAEVSAAAAKAEELGFETFWLAEGHFSGIGLPSALTLLSALSRMTSSIRLGTAVVPLAFEHPIRLAEVASLVNVLSNDRLELGVGKSNGNGFSSFAFQAFDIDENDREAHYARALSLLREVLDTGVATASGSTGIYPPPGNLARRIWQATGSQRTAAAAGAAGDGLQLHRSTPQGNPGDVQAELISAYLGSFDSASGSPRIGISRAIVPAASRREAVSLVERDIVEHPGNHPLLKSGQSPEEYLVSATTYFGSADDILEELDHDKAFQQSTDYLFSISLPFGSGAYTAGLDLIASAIYPHLPVAKAVPRLVSQGAPA